MSVEAVKHAIKIITNEIPDPDLQDRCNAYDALHGLLRDVEIYTESLGITEAQLLSLVRCFLRYDKIEWRKSDMLGCVSVQTYYRDDDGNMQPSIFLGIEPDGYTHS